MALGTGLGALATHILCIVLARRFSNLKVGTSVSSFSLARLRELVSFGTAVLGTSLVAMLFDPLNKMVLARYGDVAEPEAAPPGADNRDPREAYHPQRRLRGSCWWRR